MCKGYRRHPTVAPLALTPFFHSFMPTPEGVSGAEGVSQGSSGTDVPAFVNEKRCKIQTVDGTRRCFWRILYLRFLDFFLGFLLDFFLSFFWVFFLPPSISSIWNSSSSILDGSICCIRFILDYIDLLCIPLLHKKYFNFYINFCLYIKNTFNRKRCFLGYGLT